MMNQLHQSLLKSSPAYRKWHEDKDYHLKHWAIFIAAAVVALVSLTNLINRQIITVDVYQTRAATSITAASCNQADVQTAINQAVDGDTVQISAGTCNWNSMLTIAKSVTLTGAGSGSTKLISNGADPLVAITLASDIPVRITGIYFDLLTNANGSPSAIHINGKKNGSFGYTKIRIDHNTFNKGTRQIFWIGWAYGVIDHNTFINGNIAVGLNGDDSYAWSRPIAPGSADAVFIEDNTFIINNDTDREPNQQIYHQQGARSVARHNVFDGTAYSDGNSVWYDSHGNWPCGGPPVDPDSAAAVNCRAQPLVEVYENIFSGHHSYEWGDQRGGVTLFWNNSLTYTTGGAPVFKITDEESWQTLLFNPLRTVWPAREQITNSHFWGNTRNGTPLTLTLNHPQQDAIFLQENRDYFMRAPQPGDTYYPYTPYPYPHPLAISGGTAVTPPPPPPPPPEDTTPPTVSITSSVNGSSITRASSLAIQAQATDDTAVSEVKFFINGTLKCTDTSPTQTSIGSLGGQASLFYTCSWNVPGRVGRTYRLQTMAYDTSGNFAASSIVTVTAK